MRKICLVVLATLVISVLVTSFVYAEVPHLIRFQGKLTDKNGAPLNGSYNVTFRIYDAETGGTLEWSETQSAVPVNNGIFTVLLGSAVSVDLPFDESYWLSMEVNNDGEMTPRQRISSVGYAMRAEVADTVAGEVTAVPSGAIILWTGASCPTGYTRVVALDGKFIAGAATYNANAGGSNTHTHSASTASAGSHNHGFSVTISGNTGPASASSGAQSGADQLATNYHNHSFSGTGSGTTTAAGAHTHTVTVTEADNRPEFATVLFCQKD